MDTHTHTGQNALALHKKGGGNACKRTVSATKAVEIQGKGTVSAHGGGGTTGQKAEAVEPQCPTRVVCSCLSAMLTLVPARHTIGAPRRQPKRGHSRCPRGCVSCRHLFGRAAAAHAHAPRRAPGQRDAKRCPPPLSAVACTRHLFGRGGGGCVGAHRSTGARSPGACPARPTCDPRGD